MSEPHKNIKDIDPFSEGVSLRNSGKFSEALILFNSIMENKGERAGLKTAIGVTYRMMGDYPQAIKYIMEDIRQFPGLEWLNYELGLTYRIMGEYDKSITAFEKELHIAPKSSLHNEISLAYQLQIDRALSSFNDFKRFRQNSSQLSFQNLPANITTITNGYIEGLKSDGYAYEPPYSVQIGISNVCCDRCLFCSYQSAGIPPDEADMESHFDDELFGKYPSLPHYDMHPETLHELKKTKFMTIDNFSALAQELSSLGVKEIAFIGIGESLAHPQFIDFIRIAKKLNFHCSLYTNGALLDKQKIDLLIQSQLDYINISIDSSTDYAHKTIHNSQVSLSSIITNLEYLKLQKLKLKKLNPILNLSFTVIKHNLNDISKFMAVIEKSGASSCYFSPVVTTYKTRHLQLNSDELIKFYEAFKELKAQGDHKNIGMSSTMSLYENKIHHYLGCFVGWKFCRIFPDGSVTYCCGCSDIMGNVFKDKFQDIWNNDRYRKKRRQSLIISDNIENYNHCFCVQCPHAPSLLHLHSRTIKMLFGDFLLDNESILREIDPSILDDPFSALERDTAMSIETHQEGTLTIINMKKIINLIDALKRKIGNHTSPNK